MLPHAWPSPSPLQKCLPAPVKTTALHSLSPAIFAKQSPNSLEGRYKQPAPRGPHRSRRLEYTHLCGPPGFVRINHFQLHYIASMMETPLQHTNHSHCHLSSPYVRSVHKACSHTSTCCHKLLTLPTPPPPPHTRIQYTPNECMVHGIALVRSVQLHVDHVVGRTGHLQHFIGGVAHPPLLKERNQT